MFFAFACFFRLQNIIVRFLYSPATFQQLYGIFTPLSFLNYPLGKQIIDQVFGNTKWATKKQLLLSIIRLVHRDLYIHFITVPLYLGSISSPIYPKQPVALCSLLKYPWVILSEVETMRLQSFASPSCYVRNDRASDSSGGTLVWNAFSVQLRLTLLVASRNFVIRYRHYSSLCNST